LHEIIIIIAKYFIVISLLVSLLVWLKLTAREKKEFIALAIVGGILALIFAKIGSKLFYDPRPFVVGHTTPYFSHAPDNGFPSDHTLLASLLAFVVVKYDRRIGYALLVVAVLIGLARVIADVHHLIDIVGSIIFSGIAVFIAVKAVSYFFKKNDKPSKITSAE